ncbi:M56 family metallopeptidase [Streptomyces sp. NPDC002602]|uniref:M56 family metallopeptidase n=1 Tax=Streptomyces sp. NPDC002602 TaxID=3364654 RepID=UPI0036BFBAFD
MGLLVFLPLVLPLTAWPLARPAAQHLHPRTATWLLTGAAAALALCSTLCLALLMVVGTAQLPGNPLPDAWSDPEVRAALPYDEVAGPAAIPALAAVLGSAVAAVWRARRVRRDCRRALAGLADGPVAVLPAAEPYAYALPGPGRHGGRVVVTTGLLSALDPAERRALFAHERAHLAGRHHRFLTVVRLAACANPFLRPLCSAVSYTAERWADEVAAARVGNRRTVATAIGKAALLTRTTPPGLPAATAGPVPRRVAALLSPAPPALVWPPLRTAAGLATWSAAAGTTVSALSSANSAVTLICVLRTATAL